jgi:hypothetical protein
MSMPNRGQSAPTGVSVSVVVAVALASAPLLAQRPDAAAAGFERLFIHDECSAANPDQTDTCLHEQRHEKAFTFGGTAGVVYDVTLRIRGLFEPTTMAGAEAPDAAHPFFVIGGEGKTLDYSQWQIAVSEPARVYTLNHYPSVSHTIYKEDFEATIPVGAGAKVVVSVTDGNTRQIDNGFAGTPDRRQILEGVVDTPKPGQMLRLDVVRVTARR